MTNKEFDRAKELFNKRGEYERVLRTLNYHIDRGKTCIFKMDSSYHTFGGKEEDKLVDNTSIEDKELKENIQNLVYIFYSEELKNINELIREI